MPSTLIPHASTSAYAVSALGLFAAFTNAHSHDRSLLSRREGTVRARQALNTMTYQGCYSSSTGLTDQGSYQYQSNGYCQPICVKANQAVLGLSGGSDCWCGDEIPPASSKVDDSNCNTPCQGYGDDNCGGTNFWSVYLSGLTSSAPNAGGSSSSSATSAATSAPSTATTPPPSSTSPTTTGQPSVVTSVAPGQTIVVTEPAQHASTSTAAQPTEQHKSSTNVAGIAAGVVVGVVAAAAIIGGLIFFLKRRRQQAAEDEYKRSNQVTDFMRGGREPKPPPSAWSNVSDQRLDPTAGMKRNSAGSIADAADYSRKILRVANPDGN